MYTKPYIKKVIHKCRLNPVAFNSILGAVQFLSPSQFSLSFLLVFSRSSFSHFSLSPICVCGIKSSLAIMNNEEEKRCPLCAEEMDWTDQQFKPCQCGYQVCVWCWHHIMDMAEKDQTEGRCPACRVIYEKEKIVAMQANSERVVMKSSNNKKCKPPKSKPKAPEVKKDLTNVRVIQRKMAYVIGLPLSLADEDLLQRKEYFGQYGKITKMSLSRTAGGAVQHFINDSCSVYVTYSREEEALRCIQSVHGFVLEGRFLRASFGTAKYCHAWLKSMPCSNPACLYLHNVGAEEDSFGKDEIAAVHTRNRVQQIVGAGNNMLRRVGSILPPPVDELSNSSSTIERSTAKGPLIDLGHGCHSSGGFSVPSKVTTFVDIVGRSSSPGLEKDGTYTEDGRITSLSSEFSSVNIDNKDYQLEDIYANSMPYKVSSSAHLVNRLSLDTEPKEFSDELFREDFTPFHSLLSEESSSLSQRVGFQHSPYPSQVAEDSGDHSLMHRRNLSSSNYSADQTSVHSLEEEAFLPMTCVNSVLNDGNHELKFQNSAKSDRIYRNSNSFSNEEIVEHLRRIDDDNLTNNDLLDETGDQRGSSWNSYTSRKSGFSFAKGDGFVNQMANFEPSFNNLGQVPNDCYVLHNYGANNEHYLSKPQYQAVKPPSMAPPGFSVPREGPPGFSTYEQQAGRFPRTPSGNLVSNSSSLNSILQEPPRGSSSSSCAEVDFLDPAILNCEKGKPTNVHNIPGMGTRCGSKSQMSAFDDEARLWLLMQQPTSTEQDSKSSQVFLQQTPTVCKESRFPGHVGEQLSLLDNVYGYSLDQCPKYETSSNTPLSHQKLANGHSSKAYQYSLDEVHRRNEIGMGEIQRNEKLGLNKYFSGYGDLMLSMANSGDVYTKVFGMQL